MYEPIVLPHIWNVLVTQGLPGLGSPYLCQFSLLLVFKDISDGIPSRHVHYQSVELILEPERVLTGKVDDLGWAQLTQIRGPVLSKNLSCVLVLIVVGAGTALLFIPQSSDSFRLEGMHPDGVKESAYLWLANLQDCALNISFVDDPELLYIIDVELYEPSPASSAFEMTVNDYREQSGWMDIRFNGILSIKSLQVVLGSGVPYEIVVPSSGSNVNATLIYGNNVLGSGASLHYSATGSIANLIFTEDMVFSETGMEVGLGGADYVYFHMDLADGLNGKATFREPLFIHSNTGWTFRSQFFDQVTYSTDPLNPEPLLEIAIGSEYGVHVWLSD